MSGRCRGSLASGRFLTLSLGTSESSCKALSCGRCLRRKVQEPTWCYDLHATVLHLLGIDHERLTFRHNGANRRLTDVHGRVIEEILA